MVEDASGLAEIVWGVIETALEWFADGRTKANWAIGLVEPVHCGSEGLEIETRQPSSNTAIAHGSSPHHRGRDNPMGGTRLAVRSCNYR